MKLLLVNYIVILNFTLAGIEKRLIKLDFARTNKGIRNIQMEILVQHILWWKIC